VGKSIVYYGYIGNDMYVEPEKVWPTAIGNCLLLSKLHSDGTAGGVTKCPAFKEFYKNTFLITSPFDYKLNITDRKFQCYDYDQDFYDRYIITRDVSNRVLSLRAPEIIFFSEDKNLELEMLPPLLSPNMFSNCLYITGKYNIGKHFRTLELALALREDKELEINSGDSLYYVRFNTDNEVELRRFLFNTELMQIITYITNIRTYTKKIKPLCEYYTKAMQFGYRNKILKNIRKNLF